MASISIQPIEATCDEIMEAESLKMTAPTVNLWTIFELPVRNFDCSITLPSIIQLELEIRQVYPLPASHPSFNYDTVKLLPIVVNDCIFRIWVWVAGRGHEALVDVEPFISRACCVVKYTGLKVHRLSQGVDFGPSDIISRCFSRVKVAKHNKRQK